MYLIAAVMQVALSTIPGFILMQDGVSWSWGLTYLVLYLILTELSQLLLLTITPTSDYNLPFYFSKLVVSLLLIWLIANRLTWQYAVILVAFEVFQFLRFSQQYRYFTELSYTLTNALFKGLVFNLLISLAPPFNLRLLMFQPYILSFLVLLVLTSCAQLKASDPVERKTFSRTLVLSLCLFVGYLGYLSFKQDLSLLLLIGLCLCLVFSIGCALQFKRPLRTNVCLALGGSLILLLFYLNT